MAAKRPTTFSMRMPEDINEKINAYAAEHNCTKAEAMSHFARAGIELEERGPEQSVSEPSASNVVASQDTLEKIEQRLEALQNLPTIEAAEPPATLVPVDIRDKIQAYSTEHECSERDAMAYYARLGVQLSDTMRPARAKEIAELRTRLDVLAQDSQTKSKQLAQMSEMLNSIHEYTKPDELVLEGEVADDAEDVEEPELTEEERRRQEDERTRKIVSDVMSEYAAMQYEEREQERQIAAQSGSALNAWIPVFVAVIISLLIGLVVILTRWEGVCHTTIIHPMGRYHRS